MEIISRYILFWAPCLLLLLFVLTPLFLLLRYSFTVARSLYQINIDMSRLSSLDDLEDFVLNEDIHQWALRNDFSAIGTFHFKTRDCHTFISKWTDPQKYTVLSFVFARAVLTKLNLYENRQSYCLSFSTYYEGDLILETSNSTLSHFYPVRVIKYEEYFPGVPIEILYRQHVASRQYLIENGEGTLTMSKHLSSKAYLNALIKNSRYIQSIPFWLIRYVIWHFFQKHRGQNLSIQEQHEKGMIKLPNEH